MKLPKVLPENFLVDIRGLSNAQKIKIFSILLFKYNCTFQIGEPDKQKCLIKYSGFSIEQDKYFVIRSFSLTRLPEEPWCDLKDYPVYFGKTIINKIINKLK